MIRSTPTPVRNRIERDYSQEASVGAFTLGLATPGIPCVARLSKGLGQGRAPLPTCGAAPRRTARVRLNYEAPDSPVAPLLSICE
jgi:hypothetical protein